jgi:hypothetical protein
MRQCMLKRNIRYDTEKYPIGVECLKWASQGVKGLKFRRSQTAPVAVVPEWIARPLLVQFAKGCRVQVLEHAPFVTFCNLLPKKHRALCRSLWTHRTVR